MLVLVLVEMVVVMPLLKCRRPCKGSIGCSSRAWVGVRRLSAGWRMRRTPRARCGAAAAGELLVLVLVLLFVTITLLLLLFSSQ